MENPSTRLSSMICESMYSEGEYLVNKIRSKFNTLASIDIRNDPHYYSTSGRVLIDVQFLNGYGAEIVWSDFSIGGKKLLWELTPTKTGFDLTDPTGNLDSHDILERLTRLSNM